MKGIGGCKCWLQMNIVPLIGLKHTQEVFCSEAFLVIGFLREGGFMGVGT